MVQTCWPADVRLLTMRHGEQPLVGGATPSLVMMWVVPSVVLTSRWAGFTPNDVTPLVDASPTLIRSMIGSTLSLGMGNGETNLLPLGVCDHLHRASADSQCDAGQVGAVLRGATVARAAAASCLVQTIFGVRLNLVLVCVGGGGGGDVSLDDRVCAGRHRDRLLTCTRNNVYLYTLLRVTRNPYSAIERVECRQQNNRCRGAGYY